MKKSLLIFALSFIVVGSSYAKTVEPVAVSQVAQSTVSAWESGSDNSQDDETQAEEASVVESACTTCAPEIEEKVPVKCAKDVKTVRYTDKCTHGCGFPITVRVESECSSEGEK